jgi:hypothetical protein
MQLALALFVPDEYCAVNFLDVAAVVLYDPFHRTEALPPLLEESL